MTNEDIINNTVYKSILTGILAGTMDYHFGVFSHKTATNFGIAVGVGVGVASLLQLSPFPDKSLKFVTAVTTESAAAIALSRITDTSTLLDYPKYNYHYRRIGIVIAADSIANIIMEGFKSDGLYKF